jgi:acetyl esterase/lipase
MNPTLQLVGVITETLFNARTYAIAVFVAGLTLSGVHAESAATALRTVRPIRDVSYYRGPGADPAHHKLDLYLPNDEKDFPVVLFVHGGAWQRGSKEFLGVYQALGTCLAQHGIGAAVINYRLSPAVQHPEHIRDVARAFAWAHKHIAAYGGRPDRLFVCGHSAGGHLVSLLACDPAWLKAEGLTPASICGVISMSGVYDLSELPERLLSRTFGADSDVMNAASPTHQARGGLPPFLIFYADHDLPGCDAKPAQAFAKALKDKGTKAEIHEVVESNHYKILLSSFVADSPVGGPILKFIADRCANP